MAGAARDCRVEGLWSRLLGQIGADSAKDDEPFTAGTQTARLIGSSPASQEYLWLVEESLRDRSWPRCDRVESARDEMPSPASRSKVECAPEINQHDTPRRCGTRLHFPLIVSPPTSIASLTSWCIDTHATAH